MLKHGVWARLKLTAAAATARQVGRTQASEFLFLTWKLGQNTRWFLFTGFRKVAVTWFRSASQVDVAMIEHHEKREVFDVTLF